jgi:putative Ca2+/H+ antiporter (TMEM165/GDT1 family)
MDAFVVSTCVVALAEIGDKTQLLSLALAARYRRPWPIAVGILLATLVNHGLAGALGTWITQWASHWITQQALAAGLGVSFLAMAAWMLVPDRLDDEALRTGRWGVFATTLVAFFLAEMGDKTQLATIALAARLQALTPVVLGTTVGMMIANLPVVFVGKQLGARIPVRTVHAVAAAVFAAFGIACLIGGARGLAE